LEINDCSKIAKTKPSPSQTTEKAFPYYSSTEAGQAGTRVVSGGTINGIVGCNLPQESFKL
jgi:hypothetical protein